ncbi:uncharacterized protein V6R79_001212 [Siganus canaliculatus]
MPYCVFEGVLSHEILFLHTKEGDNLQLVLAPVRRDRRTMPGSLFAELLNYTPQPLPTTLMCDPRLFLLACEHLIGIEEPLSPLVFQPDSALQCEAEADSCASGGRERPEQTAARAGFLLSSLVVTHDVSRALFRVLNRS